MDGLGSRYCLQHPLNQPHPTVLDHHSHPMGATPCPGCVHSPASALSAVCRSVTGKRFCSFGGTAMCRLFWLSSSRVSTAVASSGTHLDATVPEDLVYCPDHPGMIVQVFQDFVQCSRATDSQFKQVCRLCLSVPVGGWCLPSPRGITISSLPLCCQLHCSCAVFRTFLHVALQLW